MIMGYRIITAFTPGVAGQQTFSGKPTAFENTKAIDGFDRILRTGWCIAAMMAEHGTDRELVETYG
jgi:hypothetical protein